MSSLPFTISGACGGFVDLEGIARLEGAELALEFRTVHPLSEFFPSVPPKEVRVAVRELEEAAFKRRLWLGYLHLRARSMNAFSTVPGNKGCELRLRCRRAHWATARELASKLSLSVVAQEIKAMVDSNKPPPREG